MKNTEPQEGSRGKKFSLSLGKKRKEHFQTGGIKTESKRRPQNKPIGGHEIGLAAEATVEIAATDHKPAGKTRTHVMFEEQPKSEANSFKANYLHI